MVGYAKVFGGSSGSVALASHEPVGVMVQKEWRRQADCAHRLSRGPVRAPIEPGQPVGVVKVWRGPNIAVETPLYTTEAVGVGSTMRRAFDGVSELVIGLFRSSTRKL